MNMVATDSGQARLLRFEQIRLLYSAMPVTIVATLINATVLIFFEWDAVEHWPLLIWYALMLLITGGRLIITLAFHRSRPGLHQFQRWEPYFVAGAISAALAWGCSPLLLFPTDSIAHQVFLAFIVGGMAAGSVTSLSPMRLTVFGFLFITLMPLSIRFFMVGNEIATAMGALILLFLLLTSFNAFKSHRETIQNITLRLESTEREKALRHSEKRLRESEQTYHGIFNSLHEAVFIQDELGYFLDVNEGAVRMYGYPREQFLNRTPAFLSAPDRNNLSQVTELIGKAFDGETQQFEFWGIDATGRQFPKEVCLYPGEYFGQKVVIAIAQDISERRQLESRLVQSQKLEAIGRLVGGIAHDFNNTLAAIMGNLHLARLHIAQQKLLSEKLDNIDGLSAHASAIVQQLLAFARRDIVETSNLSLTSFLKEQIKLTETIIPKNIRLTFNLCDEELYVVGNSVQLQQVLMNLLNNARDALADTDKPEINCTLAPFTASKAFLKKHPTATTEKFAHLQLADNGSGIPESILEHIFEPFFTTKEAGKGTGLGLAMAYGAIQTHHGIFEVESKPNRGTTFHIYLPLSETQVAPAVATAAPQAKNSRHGKGETILLVDDEESLLTTMQEILEHYGYQVLTAESGEEAVEIFSAHHDKIALVILDVVMPRMNGEEAARHIRETNASIPIIFITGYDKEYLLKGDALNLERSMVLRKPVSIDMLNNSINKMI